MSHQTKTTKTTGETNRLQRLAYLVLVLIGVILLAGSLSDLTLEPGEPIPGAVHTVETAVLNSSNREPIKPAPLKPFLLFTLGVLFLILTVVVVFQLVKKVNFRKILPLLLIGVVSLGLFLLVHWIPEGDTAASAGIGESYQAGPSLVLDVKPIGEPPERLFTFVLIAAALLFLGGVFWFGRQVGAEINKTDPLLETSTEAVNALASGMDYRDVVLKSYFQMLDVLKSERGLERESAVTVREFQLYLVEKGIHDDAVQGLTRLFEKVRYGGKESDQGEQMAAFRYFSQIRDVLSVAGDSDV